MFEKPGDQEVGIPPYIFMVGANWLTGKKNTAVRIGVISELLLTYLSFCFSSLVLHHAKYHTCLTEETTVGQEMCGFVTATVMWGKCASSEWELRFR